MWARGHTEIDEKDEEQVQSKDSMHGEVRNQIERNCQAGSAVISSDVVRSSTALCRRIGGWSEIWSGEVEVY